MVTHHGSCFNHSEAGLQRWKREDSCRVHIPWWGLRANTACKDVTAEWSGELNMRDPHWNQHFCLSPVNKYDVRLKLLKEQVYQLKLQCMIITPCCTRRWIPECVKAVIIAKKRTMQVFHYHFVLELSSQGAPICWNLWEQTLSFLQNQKSAKLYSMWLLCPLVADLLGFILTFTFTSSFWNSLITLVTHFLCSWAVTATTITDCHLHVMAIYLNRYCALFLYTL